MALIPYLKSEIYALNRHFNIVFTKTKEFAIVFDDVLEYKVPLYESSFHFQNEATLWKYFKLQHCAAWTYISNGSDEPLV